MHPRTFIFALALASIPAVWLGPSAGSAGESAAEPRIPELGPADRRIPEIGPAQPGLPRRPPPEIGPAQPDPAVRDPTVRGPAVPDPGARGPADDALTLAAPPEEFTPSDAEEAAEIREKLLRHADILLDPEVTGERERTISEESRRLIQRLDWLERKRLAWIEWEAGHARRDPEGSRGNPGVQRDDPAASGGLDHAALLRIILRARSMTYATLTSDPRAINEVNAIGYDDTGPDVWEKIAADLLPYQHVRFDLADPSAAFLLRAGLVQGKSWIYASGRHLAAGSRKAHMEAYEKGIRALQRVLAIANLARNRGVLDRIDVLPSDLEPFVRSPDAFTPDELDEAAAIGTHAERGTTTSEEAMAWLAAVCPWGADLYFFLKDARLAPGLDLAILPAFYRPATIEQPEKLYVTSVKPDFVPVHVRRQLEEMHGGGAPGQGRRGWSEGGTGRIRRGGRMEELRWAVVQDPSYSVWVISPAVFAMKPSEILSLTGHLRKIGFGLKEGGKKLYGLGNYACDWIMSLELDFTGWAFGEESDAYAVSQVLVEGNNAGILDSDLLIDYAEKGFNWTKLAHTLAVHAFKWSEEKEIEYLFEGIDPEDVGWSGAVRSYDGRPIPPVILRGEVFGFDRIEPHEYLRTRRIVRYALLDPRGLGGGQSYRLDLLGPLQADGVSASGSYHAGNESVQTKTWPPLPGSPPPPSCREYVQDYTPLAQFIFIDIDANTWSSWKEEAAGAPIDALVFDGSQEAKPAADRRHAVSLRLERPVIALQLRHRPYYPKGLQDLPPGVADRDLLGKRLTLCPARANLVLADPKAGPAGAIVAEACAILDLTHSYAVRIVSGKRGERTLGEFPVRFTSKAGREGWRATGKIHWPEPGLCFLEQRHPWLLGQPIAVKPVTEGLLPVKLLLSGAALYSSTDPATGLVKMPYRTWRLTIRGRLSGQSLERRWYRADVVLGDRRYVAWGGVRHDGGSATLECSLPVPVGRHEVTVTIPGVAEARLVVERSGPDRPPGVDLAALEARYRTALGRHRGNPTDSTRSSLGWALDGLSEGLASLQRYDECYRACQEYMGLFPNQRYPAKFYSRVFDASFWAGQAQSTLWAGAQFAECLYGEEARRLLGQKPDDSRGLTSASSAMGIYIQTIELYVSLGGDAREAERLYLKVIELWGLTGHAKNSYRPGTYPHRGIEFGPQGGNER